MVKYTKLEDILKHAEVGDTIHLKSPKVYGDNCGEITIVDEDEYVGFQQVRKQILKNKEVTYFKGE